MWLYETNWLWFGVPSLRMDDIIFYYSIHNEATYGGVYKSKRKGSKQIRWVNDVSLVEIPWETHPTWSQPTLHSLG